MYNGGVRYNVSQSSNPKSIIYQPSSQISNVCIVRGEVSTISNDPDSLSLYRLFYREFAKVFFRKSGYFVGPEALEAYVNGVRRLSFP
jgi:hypothetical protein